MTIIPSGGILIGYARCSAGEQDLTAQRLAEQDPDLEPDRGLTGPAPKTSPAARTIRELAAAVTPALGTYPAGRKGYTFDRRMSGSGPAAWSAGGMSVPRLMVGRAVFPRSQAQVL